MGTNFYAHRIPSEEEKSIIREKVELYFKGIIRKDDIFEGFEFLDNIHLGKRSSGWQFAWREHSNLYKDNLESIKEFLTNPNIIITDEYGESFTYDEFYEEIKDFLYNDDYHIDIQEYYERYSDKHAAYDGTEYTTRDGLRFIKVDFC